MVEPAREVVPGAPPSGDRVLEPAPRVFGWRIVALGLIVNALVAGLIGAYGFMVTPLIDEFGATTAQLGTGMAILIVSMSAFTPLLGPLFDRGPLRAVMLAGVAVMFFALFGLSRGTSLWQLAMLLSLAAVGLSMFGMFPAKVMIVNWFVRRRGTALAIAYAGTSVAGFAVPPITAWLIETSSWRGAVFWLATGAALIAAPAIAAMAVRRPEDVGQHPDGDATAAPAPGELDAAARAPLARFARDPNFWLIGLGDALAMCVPVATGIFFVRHLELVGIPRMQIALVLPVMAAFSLIGKLGAGYLADRMNLRLLAVGTLVLHVTGLWIVAFASGIWDVALAAIPLGLGGGGFIPLPSVLQGVCFGRLVIGRVSGFHSFMGLPLLLSSAPLAGALEARTGSFVVPFLALGGVQLLAAAVLAFVRVPRTAD